MNQDNRYWNAIKEKMPAALAKAGCREDEISAIEYYCRTNPYAAKLVQEELDRWNRRYGQEPAAHEQAMKRFLRLFLPNAKNWKHIQEYTFLDDLFSQANAHPERTAIVDENGTRTTSYAEFVSRIRKAARKIQTLNLTPGSFIIINMGRTREYLTSFYAILCAGYAVIPLVPDIPEEREAYIREESKSELTIHLDFFDDIDQYDELEVSPRKEDDIALMLYTSGSTGRPKGVFYTFGPLSRLFQRAVVFLDGIDPIIYGSSIAYSFAAISVDTCHVFCAGGTMHILPDEVRKDVFAMNAYYQKHGLTTGNVHPRLHKLFKPGPQLRRIFTSGHRITDFYSDQFETVLGYGLAETFTVPTCFLLDRAYKATPVGKQYNGFNVIVCDEAGNEVPDGTEGEVRMAGDLSEGYFGMPELTAKTFERRPDGTVLLHTHDIGYKDENGDLVLLNRDDWMVKINGMSVNPAEIDYAMSSIKGIRETAAKGFEDHRGNPYLCSFYVTDDNSITPEYLRQELSKTLMPYMIPSFFIRMEQLPQTISSKVDYTRLLAPDTLIAEVPYEAPRDELEARICDVFAHVLDRKQVGRNDDFFHLGGDSLSVMEVAAEIEDDRISVAVIVQEKTPAAIAARARQSVKAVHGSEKDRFALTPYQNRYLEFCTMAKGITMGNSPTCFEADPSHISPEQLQKAVTAALRLHPSYRTKLTKESDGTVSQSFCTEFISVPEIISLQESELDDAMDQFLQPFELFDAPLLRSKIILTPSRLLLLFDVHHIISDAISMQNLVRDIDLLLYQKTPTSDAYLDYLARMDAKTANGEIVALQETLVDRFLHQDYVFHPAPDLSNPSFHTSMVKYAVRLLPERLRLRADGTTVRIQTAIIAAALLAMRRDTGSDKVLVNWLYHGRDTFSKQNMTGLLITSMPVAVDFSKLQSAEALFSAIDEMNTEMLGQAECSPGTLLSGPLSEDILTVNYDMHTSTPLQSFTGTKSLINRNTANTNIFYLIVNEYRDHNAEILFKYNDTLYSEEHIRRFAESFFEAVRECSAQDSWIEQL